MQGEAPPLGGRHRRVDELMLHLARAKIDELAVCEVEQQQIIEQLGPVPGSKVLDGLELKQRSFGSEDIEKVSLGERAVRHVHLCFQPHAGESLGEFLLVNALVEQASEIAVNGEDVCHHAKRDFTKFFLG